MRIKFRIKLWTHFHLIGYYLQICLVHCKNPALYHELVSDTYIYALIKLGVTVVTYLYNYKNSDM